MTPIRTETRTPVDYGYFCGHQIEFTHKDEKGLFSIRDTYGDRKVLIGNREHRFAPKMALASAATLPDGRTGHMATYQEGLFGQTNHVLMVPANGTFLEGMGVLVKNANVIGAFGGNHPGPNFMGSAAPSYRVGLHGGYDHKRDTNEFTMLQHAIELGKPIVAVCRGQQTVLALLLAHAQGIDNPKDMHHIGCDIFEPAERHHSPSDDGSIHTHPLLNILPQDLRHLCPWLQGFTPVSNHLLKTTLGFMQGKVPGRSHTREDLLREKGWHIAAVDGTEGIRDHDRAVELVVRLNGGREIDSWLMQGHPEKPNPLRTEQQAQWHAQHMWSQQLLREPTETITNTRHSQTIYQS